MTQLRIFAGLLFLSAAGCGLNVFHTEVEAESTVPGNSSPLPGLLNAFPGLSNFSQMDFNQNQDFKNQGVTKDQVTSVTLDSATLQIESPSNQDFSFLQSLQFIASADGQTAVIAQKSGIDQLNLPAPNPTLSMDVPQVELKPYVTAPSMTISVQGSGHQPPQDTVLKVKVRLRVEAKIL